MHKKRNGTVIVNQTLRKNRMGTRIYEFVDVDVVFKKIQTTIIFTQNKHSSKFRISQIGHLRLCLVIYFD